MQFHTQLVMHDPDNGKLGDCHRTALACLLNKKPEEVPHFGEFCFDPVKYHEMKQEYLKTLGLAEFSFPVQGESPVSDVTNSIGSWNTNLLYMLSGKSSRGTNHIVVCRGYKMIHDPHPSNEFICGPCNDNFYWVSVLTPILEN